MVLDKCLPGMYARQSEEGKAGNMKGNTPNASQNPQAETAARPSQCNEYRQAPRKCSHLVFTSADGGTRCHGCHLYPDQCNCGGQVLRLLWMLGVVETLDGKAPHTGGRNP